MENTFSLSFGNTPHNEIKRYISDYDIIADFNRDKSASNAYMVTGVRGSGKTVFMTDICRKLRDADNWIVAEISSEENILFNIAYRLSNEKAFAQTVVKAGIDLSVLSVEVSKATDASMAPVSLLVENLLEIIKKQNKKLLVAIDEAINNQYIKAFAHQFQIYIRKELPIYLLMTGLYENIYEIQNEKTLTFLYRTPRVELQPLKLYLIRESYKEIFNLEDEVADKMAKMTKGYPFAYQVLGYLFYESKDKILEKLENSFCNYLGEYVYEKIWSEMSAKDKEVVAELTKVQDKIKIQDFRERLGVDSSKFSHYRDRLKRKGVVDVSEYGYISFSLPYFREYIEKAFLE